MDRELPYTIMCTLPDELRDLVEGGDLRRVAIGESGARTYAIHSDGRDGVYLKITASESVYSVRREHDVLAWLQGKLPVPRILHYGGDETCDYLLVSEMPGFNACDQYWKNDVGQVVRSLAEGLRMIHALDISGCPFDQTLEAKLREASERVSKGLVDISAFEPEWQNLTPADILSRLHSEPPPAQDLVFTHGDYCLPNIIVNNKHLSGFVDWGSAGESDRYQDLALAARSLACNWGEEWVPLLLDEYGVGDVDEGKMEYYRLLDELF